MVFENVYPPTDLGFPGGVVTELVHLASPSLAAHFAARKKRPPWAPYPLGKPLLPRVPSLGPLWRAARPQLMAVTVFDGYERAPCGAVELR